MGRRDWAIEVVAGIVGDRIKAEIVIDRLNEEGVLHLGYGNVDVDKVVEKFTDTFGTTKTSKYDRFAAKRLVDKYGSDSVVGIIGLLGDRSAEKYAPVVNNLTELENKWISVLNFLRNRGEEIIEA